jgi:hypothetical protein
MAKHQMEQAFASWSCAHRQLVAAEQRLGAAWTDHARGAIGIPSALVGEVAGLRHRCDRLLDVALHALRSLTESAEPAALCG